MTQILIKQFVLTMLLLLTVVAPSIAHNIDIEKAKKLFALTKKLSDVDGGKLWGVRLYGPILFVDPQTRMIVTNTKDKQHFLSPLSACRWFPGSAARSPSSLAALSAFILLTARLWISGGNSLENRVPKTFSVSLSLKLLIGTPFAPFPAVENV